MPTKNTPPSLWLFADSLKPGEMFEYVEEKQYVSKKGTEIPILILLGTALNKENKPVTGEYQISTWNIENLNELIETLGEDEKIWIGKRFQLDKGIKEGKIIMTEVTT